MSDTWIIQQDQYGSMQPLTGRTFESEAEASCVKHNTLGRLKTYLLLFRQGEKMGDKTEADLMREIAEVEQWKVVKQ